MPNPMQLGDSNQQGGISGCAFATRGPVGTDANTNPKVLVSYTVPAHVFNSVQHHVVRVTIFGSYGVNNNTKDLILQVGDIIFGTISGSTQTNNKNWLLQLTIVGNVAAQSVAYLVSVFDPSAFGAITAINQAGGRAETAVDGTQPFGISLTGQNGTASANDIVCTAMVVEYLNSPS